MKKNYVIEYLAYNSQGTLIKSGKIRAKNKDNNFVAKAGLEDHFKRSLDSFSRLEVKSCKVENPFETVFGKNKSNPFNR
jgi:hypothetical protein